MCDFDFIDTNGCDTSSSIRYKENIENLEYGLEELLALRPISFTYKEAFSDGDPSRKIGFIAEEMASTVPEVIDYGNDGQVEGIQYGNLTAILTRAIQQIAAITGTFKQNLITWLADASNGITKIVTGLLAADRVETDELCLGSTCVTEAQLQALLSQPAAAAAANPSPPEPPPLHESATSTEAVAHEFANSEEPTSVPAATSSSPTMEAANDNPEPAQNADEPANDNAPFPMEIAAP